MKVLIDAFDPNNIVGILIRNLFTEEDIMGQRSPLDSVISAKLNQKLKASCLPTLFDLVALGHYIGPCVR